MQTTLSLNPPPPRFKHHLTCHLSTLTLGKKKRDHLKAPAEEHVELSHLRGRGWRALRDGGYLRDWKLGGVSATQREVRKGKLAIHEALGRAPFLGRGGVHSGAMNKFLAVGSKFTSQFCFVTEIWGHSCILLIVFI